MLLCCMLPSCCVHVGVSDEFERTDSGLHRRYLGHINIQPDLYLTDI